jgi:predicted O-methyltransferase YrrM
VSQRLQDEQEISALADLFAKEGVRSYLEIGSKFGGSLARIAAALPVGSRILAIDMPNGTKAWPQSSVALESLILDLGKKGYDARLMWADSQDPKTVLKAGWMAPFDAVFIDADHRLPGVTADWKNYGPMGSIVAFHDIAWRRAPEWVGTRIDVPQFWDSIKLRYRHREFKFCPTGKNNGIGVLWNTNQP